MGYSVVSQSWLLGGKEFGCLFLFQISHHFFQCTWIVFSSIFFLIDQTEKANRKIEEIWKERFEKEDFSIFQQIISHLDLKEVAAKFIFSMYKRSRIWAIVSHVMTPQSSINTQAVSTFVEFVSHSSTDPSYIYSWSIGNI